MFEIIVACDKSFGIGRQGGLPWNCPAELTQFKITTSESILIMGRKTVQSIPKLPNRIVYCVTKTIGFVPQDKNNSILVPSVEKALEQAGKDHPGKRIFVAGGGSIYRYCLTNLKAQISYLHLSILKQEYWCDTFINLDLNKWVTVSRTEYDDFSKLVMKYRPNGELDYLNLLQDVLQNGNTRYGRNGETKSLFSRTLSFDLMDGFPLLTTKKMFFRGIIEELLFFIRGETNSQLLENKGVTIWKGNTSREFLDNLGFKDRPEGLMGPMYGYQWRHYNSKYDEKTGQAIDKGIDQLANIVNLIRTDPSSRRLVMTDLNPLQADQGVLYPCHSLIIQFYVDTGHLDMNCYNRSQDLFLGVPFNIASSALLLTLIARICNLTPRFLNITMGDVHIYKQHYALAEQQVSRDRYAFPTLKIIKGQGLLKELADIEKMEEKDFELVNYTCHPGIKAEMVA